MSDQEMDALVEETGREYLDCIGLIERVLHKPIGSGRSEPLAREVLASLARGGYLTVKTEKLEAMERRIEDLESQ